MTAPLLMLQIQGQGTISADNLNTYIQNCTNIALLRSFIGLPGMCVFIDGSVTPGDGGAGPFYWNTTATGPDDGVNVIVPQEGVTGAWIRLSISQTSVLYLTNIAALRSFNGGSIAPVVWVEGYSTVNDGGEGMFAYVASDTTSPDNGSTIIIDAENHRYYREFGDMPLNSKWFGATGNGVTDDTSAIQSWINAVITSGAGYCPSGNYLISSPLVFDLSPKQNYGVTFSGAGIQRTIFTAPSVSSSAPFLFTSSAISPNVFYVYVSGIGFSGNIAGPVLQIGVPSFTVPFNGCEFDCWVGNSNTSSSAICVELNGVYNCELRFTANTGGAGISLLCNQAQFNNIRGSYGTSGGGTSIVLTSGFNFGNVFSALDMENVQTCVYIENNTSNYNTWIGGTWVYRSAGFTSSTGKSNRLINPNISPILPATTSTFINGGIGVIVNTQSKLPDVTPSVPSSGTPVTNLTGVLSQVIIYGGTVTDVEINSSTVTLTSGTFFLNPGNSITITYSVIPSWVWLNVV